MRTQFKTSALLLFLSLTGILAIAPKARAHSPLAREAHAIVQIIDFTNHLVSLEYPEGYGQSARRFGISKHSLCVYTPTVAVYKTVYKNSETLVRNSDHLVLD